MSGGQSGRDPQKDTSSSEPYRPGKRSLLGGTAPSGAGAGGKGKRSSPKEATE